MPGLMAATVRMRLLPFLLRQQSSLCIRFFLKQFSIAKVNLTLSYEKKRKVCLACDPLHARIISVRCHLDTIAHPAVSSEHMRSAQKQIARSLLAAGPGNQV